MPLNKNIPGPQIRRKKRKNKKRKEKKEKKLPCLSGQAPKCLRCHAAAGPQKRLDGRSCTHGVARGGGVGVGAGGGDPKRLACFRSSPESPQRYPQKRTPKKLSLSGTAGEGPNTPGFAPGACNCRTVLGMLEKTSVAGVLDWDEVIWLGLGGFGPGGFGPGGSKTEKPSRPKNE